MDLEQKLLKQAIDELDDIHSNAGCNDLELPNTPEAVQIIKEAWAWNFRCPVEKIEQHKEWPEIIRYGNKISTQDFILIYLLRKKCGLL